MAAGKRKRSTRRRRGCSAGHVWRPNPKCRFWYLKYKDFEGIWRVDSSGRCETRKDAEKLLRQKLAALDRDEPVTPALAMFTFDTAATDLENDYEVDNRRSIGMVKIYIKKHLKPFFGGRRMASITPADVNKYIAKRKAEIIVVRQERTVTHADGRVETIEAVTKPTSNSQINRELVTLKRMFNLAIEGRKLTTRPFIKLLKEPPPRQGFLTREEFVAIKRRLPDHTQDVAEFGWITGWRVASEVVPLRWAQVDLAGGSVRIEPGASKTEDPRTFPITRSLRTLLEAQRKTTDEAQRRYDKVIPLVFHKEGQPVSRFDRLWKAAATAAGHPGTIPHDLRRCGVRNLVRAGIPERVAMQMTGHKTRSVFERYNIVSKGDYDDAVRRLDGIKSAADAQSA